MPRNSFQWREDTYSLELSTWRYWGHARFVQHSEADSELKLFTEPSLLVRFAQREGYVPEDAVDEASLVVSSQTYLENAGHRVWSVRQALAIVREDTDTDLAAQFMPCLIQYYFLRKL